MNEAALREEICEVGRRMWAKGFVAGNDGNISVRLGAGRYHCTPTGVSKGFMRPEDLCVIDDEANRLSGERGITSEIRMHLAAYAERPDVNAVIHAHSPHATAFAIAGREAPGDIMPEMEVVVGPVPLAAYALPGSDGVAESIREHLKPGITAVLLAHHGPVTTGRTLEEAWFRLEKLELYCRTVLLADGLGGARVLSQEEVRTLLAKKRQMGLDDPRFQ